MGTTETRKIIQVGNSLGITLPNSMLEELGVKKGDEVHVEAQGEELIVKRKPVMIELPQGIPPDFFYTLKEIMEQQKDILKGLVNR